MCSACNASYCNLFHPTIIKGPSTKESRMKGSKAFYSMCKVTRTWPWVWTWDFKVLPFYCAYVATLSHLYTLQFRDERVKPLYGMCKVTRTWPWVWTWDLKVILFYCTYIATLSNLYTLQFHVTSTYFHTFHVRIIFSFLPLIWQALFFFSFLHFDKWEAIFLNCLSFNMQDFFLPFISQAR